MAFIDFGALDLAIMGRIRLAGMNNPDSTLATLDIGIGGMTCASCSARVERALRKVPGVQDAAVNLATESARITFAADQTMDARLRRAVRDAGPKPAQGDASGSCASASAARGS